MEIIKWENNVLKIFLHQQVDVRKRIEEVEQAGNGLNHNLIALEIIICINLIFYTNLTTIVEIVRGVVGGFGVKKVKLFILKNCFSSKTL